MSSTSLTEEGAIPYKLELRQTNQFPFPKQKKYSTSWWVRKQKRDIEFLPAIHQHQFK